MFCDQPTAKQALPLPGVCVGFAPGPCGLGAIFLV